MRAHWASYAIPGLFAVVGAAALVVWTEVGPTVAVEARIPGLDNAPRPEDLVSQTVAVAGEPTAGPGKPSALGGVWPWFRGERFDAQVHDGPRLARQWPGGKPAKIWELSLGEGYAAAAVAQGRVFIIDHDVRAKADVMRCLSLDDGREIWQNRYNVAIAPNHGITRTVPTVIGDRVISFGPRYHVACWDMASGKNYWLTDLVAQFGATVPEWYAGQCPLYDAQADQLVLAPGGPALLVAMDHKTGEVKWKSPNPRGWLSTHSSIVIMEHADRRMYVYCGSGGVAGIAADNGELLWETAAWQVPTATCPSPVIVGDGRIFCSGGYDSGAMMLQVTADGGKWKVATIFKLAPKQFSSEQQTPILYGGYLYGVRQHDKRMVCLDLGGKEQWNSGREKFGAAPYLIADGLLLALNDRGKLTIAEAKPTGPFVPLAQADVFDDGVDAWGPMAMVSGRLLVRDFTRMACLQMAENPVQEQRHGQ